MPRDRRRITDAALAALDAELGVRRAELAVLERARDTIARDGCRCDEATGECGPIVHSALCRACGFVVRRCTAHGAQRATQAVLRYHEHQEHGDGWSESAETDDARGVLRRGAALSMGRLPSPLALDGSRESAPVESADEESSPIARTPG